MDAKELRVGNLVFRFGKVKEVTPNDLNYLIGGGKDIKPIPITEEWLIKFGFEKKSGSEFKKDRFTFRFQQRDLVIEGFEYDYNGIICNPEYVHELQNLHFALTGHELSIKELA